MCLLLAAFPDCGASAAKVIEGSLTTVAIAMAQHRTTIALVKGIIFRIDGVDSALAARSKPWRTKSLIASVKVAIVMTSSSPDRVGLNALHAARCGACRNVGSH